jgi:predicted nucleotidyltransferase
MTLLDELYAKRDTIHQLAAEHGVENVRIFGSVARGEEGPDSDVDFLIDVRADADPLGFVDFQDAMARMTGRKIDIVFDKGVFHALRERIHNEAIAL